MRSAAVAARRPQILFPKELRELLQADGEWKPVGTPADAWCSVTRETKNEKVFEFVRRLVPFFDFLEMSGLAVVEEAGHVVCMDISPSTAIVWRGKVLKSHGPPANPTHCSLVLQAQTEEERFTMLSVHFRVAFG